MSIGSELMIEEYINYSIDRAEKQREIEEGKWKTKDGTYIDIREMSNSYIENCINYLQKNKSFEFSGSWIGRFEKELEFRNYIKKIMSGELG